MIGSIHQVVEANLCISCGACCASLPQTLVAMREQESNGMFYPVLSKSMPNWGMGAELVACPGKGYNIIKMGEELFPGATSADIELGRWVEGWAGRSMNPKLQPYASSGGLMTAISEYLLKTNVVNGVVVSRMKYHVLGPRPETFIATSTSELISAQGSKYCPVPTLSIIQEIESFEGKVLFVGTPCQIAGLRMLQKTSKRLREKIPLIMGNFCGGFRDLREMAALIRRSGLRPEAVKKFRYRGGGQPGSMLIEDRSGIRAKLPYPDYARMTGFTKHKRCSLCVDATAELADFSCGDAWIPRFLSSGEPWSLVLTRSDYAEKLLQEMATEGKIKLAQVTVEEIKQSQQGNLASKKLRQSARRRLYKKFFIKMPQYDGGYYETDGGLLLELRVVVTHFLLSSLEHLGLYPLVAKLIGRYPKE